MVVFSRLPKIKFNKAYAVAFSILEHSKVQMYGDFYDKIAPRYPAGITVGLSDTDSLLLIVRHDKDQHGLEPIADIMDFSNFPTDHPLYCKANMAKLGFYKSETAHWAIMQFVALKSKCYMIETLNTIDGKRGSKVAMKGVNRSFRNRVSMDTFLTALNFIYRHKVSQNTIRSRDHVVTVERLTKVAFTSFDDKMFIMPCGLHSYPYHSDLIRQDMERGVCSFCPRID